MPIAIACQASALIDHIQTRFHDGHRQALSGLLAQAAKVDAAGADGGQETALVDALSAIAQALEQHMFKEEMRLFPMMEQGGNTLIPRLIEDLHREHVLHVRAMDAFRAQLRELTQTGRSDPALALLLSGVDELADELARHIQAEDEELFPLFAVPAAAAPPATFVP